MMQLTDKTIDRKSKWNVKLINEKDEKPLTPKAGEDKPTTSRDAFLDALKKISKSVKKQSDKEK